MGTTEMKLTVQRASFVPTFQLVSSFAATKDLRPVLQSVKLVAEDGRVILTATDAETSARAEIEFENPFNIAEEGSVLIPAKLLNKIFSETTDDEILLSSTGSRLTVKGARFKYTLDTITEIDSFPEISPFEENNCFKIASSDVRRMIKRSTFATDQLNVHYLLNGVQLIFDRDSALAVATDGRRLAVQSSPSEIVGEVPENFVAQKAFFSTRSLKLILSVAVASPEAFVAIKKESAQIKFGNVTVQTTLMSGRFPDWDQIIPKSDNFTIVNLIAGDVARAIRQSEIVTTESKPGVVLTFDDGKLVVTAEGEATGDSSVELPVSYDKEKVEMKFDPKFLTDFFKEVAPEDSVTFRFGPSEFRTLFETNDGYRYVVMQLA